jgi:hypothetical protein
MKNIQHARVQEVIDEHADCGVPFGELGSVRAESLLVKIKLMGGVGVAATKNLVS